ncbi:MAG: hypothetical protein WDA65_04050 [Christensenellales bacterium]
MFHILTKADCSKIHEEALNVLKTTVVRSKDKPMYDKLAGSA